VKSLNFITAYNYTYLHDSDSGKSRLSRFTHRWLYCRQPPQSIHIQRLSFPNILRRNITNPIPCDGICRTCITYVFSIPSYKTLQL